jgi:lipopolysaccharide transport system ATP-binding protein
VLIVDEALSVGDAYFQHKSFDRIRKYREQGTTLLLVSHDKSSIQAICDRAILLRDGKLAMEGEPEAVMDFYNAILANQEDNKVEQRKGEDGKARTDSGSYAAEICHAILQDEHDNEIDVVRVGQKVSATISVKVNKNIDGLVLGFGIKDRLGQMIFGTNTYNTKQKIEHASAGDRIDFIVTFDARLGVGSYSIHCSLVKNKSHIEKSYHWVDRLKVFEVVNVDKPEFAGCCWNEIDFRLIKKSITVGGSGEKYI